MHGGRQLRQLCARMLAADELIPWFTPRDPAGTYISCPLCIINRLCRFIIGLTHWRTRSVLICICMYKYVCVFMVGSNCASFARAR